MVRIDRKMEFIGFMQQLLLDLDGMAERMIATFKLKDYFPEEPLDNHVHVVVRIPPGECGIAFRNLPFTYLYITFVELPTCEYRWFIIV